MKTSSISFTIGIGVIFILSCNTQTPTEEKQTNDTAKKASVTTDAPLREKVLTA